MGAVFARCLAANKQQLDAAVSALRAALPTIVLDDVDPKAGAKKLYFAAL